MEGAGDAKEPPAATAAAGAAAAGAATAITEEAPKPQSTVAGLAKEAAQLFHARSYQGCLLILHQLQLHNDEDPKVRSSSGSNSSYSSHMAPLMCAVSRGRLWEAGVWKSIDG
jgi:hypothetical protein